MFCLGQVREHEANTLPSGAGSAVQSNLNFGVSENEDKVARNSPEEERAEVPREEGSAVYCEESS
jgi:hypothetical protein